MPFQRPEAEDVAALAETAGIRLTRTEAAIFADRLTRQIAEMEAFLDMRAEEHRPPLRHLTRDPGRRPTEEEDPLNAFIRRCEVRGAPDGPLAGRTVALKDHIAVAGVPLSLGSYFLDGYTPDFDASVVTRLLDAGATIVGKTNMEDFSFGGPGVAGVGDFGRPLNPHSHAHVTGGSSSGSAAAVAAGLADIALGGDQGGSIRIPAAFSGCIGLKATHGLIPHSGVFGMEESVDYVGPMTRTVADLAASLAVLAGPDGYDPRQAAVPGDLPDYVAALGRGIDGLRIGVLEEGFGSPAAEADVEDLTREAIAVLEGLGATVSIVSVPHHRTAMKAIGPIFAEGARAAVDTNFLGVFGTKFFPASFAATFGRAKHSHSHELPLNLKMILLTGLYAHERYGGRLYAKALNMRPAITRQYLEALATVDLLVMPTCPIKARRYVEPSDHVEAIERTLFGGELGESIAVLGGNTAPFNFTGLPAVSIPCGKSEGLPVGLQLVAAPFREDVLIAAAEAYEQVVDWTAIRPGTTAPQRLETEAA